MCAGPRAPAERSLSADHTGSQDPGEPEVDALRPALRPPAPGLTELPLPQTQGPMGSDSKQPLHVRRDCKHQKTERQDLETVWSPLDCWRQGDSESQRARSGNEREHECTLEV